MSSPNEESPVNDNTSAADAQRASTEDVVPTVDFMTIKNLDTGEEYIIGEKDPDFEFDTFELHGGFEERKDGILLQAPESVDNGQSRLRHSQNKSYWTNMMAWLYGSSSSKKIPQGTNFEEKPKTPFTKLSSFKFRKELGKGAFGRVLLAEAKVDGKLYALKIISKKDMRSSDKRQVKTERDILLAMGQSAPHPFTTGLKFAFQSANNLYLGMEYLPGGNLRELIKKHGYLPEHWVQFYAAELILALSHLHSLNVIYRDIKPHNVMLDVSGHITLIDYGLSKQSVSHPQGAQSLVGTPDYSAPEVLKTGVYRIEHAKLNKKNGGASPSPKKKPADKEEEDGFDVGYGKAADWWSLGVMIYEMLSGTPAFRGKDLRQTYQKVLFAELVFEPVGRFSEEAKLLLSGLLVRDPSQRLGAWENPPTDIMNASFFQSIDWAAIFEQRTPGPHVPLPVSLGPSGQSSSIPKTDRKKTDATATTMNIRDSIIVRGGNKKDPNVLQDWSFFDDANYQKLTDAMSAGTTKSISTPTKAGEAIAALPAVPVADDTAALIPPTPGSAPAVVPKDVPVVPEDVPVVPETTSEHAPTDGK